MIEDFLKVYSCATGVSYIKDAHSQLIWHLLSYLISFRNLRISLGLLECENCGRSGMRKESLLCVQNVTNSLLTCNLCRCVADPVDLSDLSTLILEARQRRLLRHL